MTDERTDEAADVQSGLTDSQKRAHVLTNAFGGDEARFEAFCRAVSEVIPAGTTVVLRGSAITGQRWKDGAAFDADGPGTSDLDVTFVGGGMVALFRDFHIPGVHSAPLSEAHPFASPTLGPLRKRLCAMCGRPVNLQATTSLVQYLRDVVMDQPYLVLLEKPEADDAKPAETVRDD
jgi:hypothetical protein